MAHLCVDDEAMAFTTRQELQLSRVSVGDLDPH